MIVFKENGDYKDYQMMIYLSKMVLWLQTLQDIHYSLIHKVKVNFGLQTNSMNILTIIVLFVTKVIPNSKIDS